MFVNQSIQRPVGVTVFGSCLLRVEPDYASVRLSVTRVEKTPADAFEKGRAGARAVRLFLAAKGLRDHDVRTSQINLEMAWEGYGDTRKWIGYRTRVAFQVMVTDLALLEEILVGAVDAGADVVEGVSFKTTRLRELRRRAREAAVLSARKKAEDYATAAQARLGNVVHIEDANPDELSRRSHMPDIDIEDHDDSPVSAAETGGSIVIAAAVMVSFSLLN